ncbi:MAG: phosphoribosylaminoimidazolecarboxamide formyltransferase [Phycisphaeraceae bacterium]
MQTGAAMEIKLKYGINPNQSFARVVVEGDASPLTVVNGKPSYINVLDGLRGWQLVRELKQATGKPAAASYKHVSPAGAAVAGELSETFRNAFFIPADAELSPLATAYAKARSSDRVASFGDFICVSDTVDLALAKLIKPEVSDGIIAPAYEPEALELLKSKKGGGYVMLQIDPDWQPPDTEYRLEFGLRLEQSYNDAVIDEKLVTSNIVTENRTLPASAVETLLVTTITLKHTQSNSVALGYAGQAVGIGAGQQSRIACTRLASEKMDRWMLSQHPTATGLQFKEDVPRSERANLVDALLRWYELDANERAAFQSKLTKPAQPITAEERTQWLKGFGDVAISSDAFFPFRDNLDRAAKSGVKYVVQSGGSKRDADVIAAADEHEMVMVMTGLRLFLH